MKQDIAFRRNAQIVLAAVILGILGFAVFKAVGQPVPPPPGPVALTNTITIAWDRNPEVDYYTAVDTNGVQVPLVYRLRQSTSITNAMPWPVIATTTNVSVVVSNLTAQTHFWYVTASNFFLESEPSRVLSLPFVRPSRVVIKIP